MGLSPRKEGNNLAQRSHFPFQLFKARKHLDKESSERQARYRKYSILTSDDVDKLIGNSGLAAAIILHL